MSSLRGHRWTKASVLAHGDSSKVSFHLFQQLQIDDGVLFEEWKVDMDSPTDTHRHLSHLIGLYPGYAITSFNQSIQSTGTNYTKAEVLAAAETSLFHRGNGTGPDADAGWEKVWRAACWAQLANATEFYHELSVRRTRCTVQRIRELTYMQYAIERNFGTNLFSLYSYGPGAIFQIDANFGYTAAVLVRSVCLHLS